MGREGKVRDTAPPSAPWLDLGCGLIATWVPFGIAVSRAASAGQWRDDLSAVRDLGLVAVGIGGGLSTLVSQALGLLPLGPRTFRAALGSALALALASRLLYGLVRRALTAAGPSPRLGAALAAIATLTAALSPTWQREGTVGGGAMIATALVLAALSMGVRAATTPAGFGPQSIIGLGAVIGAAFAESPPAALAIASITIALGIARHFDPVAAKLPRPAPRVLAAAGATAILTAAVLLAPLALRPIAPRAWVDVGRALSAASLSALEGTGARATALGAWIHEVGLVSLGIAAFGAGAALLRPRLRPLVAPLIALVVLDTLLPAHIAGILAADPLTTLRSLALAALAMSSALGVFEVVGRVLRARFPLARAAAVLVVVFHLTLVALTSEEAGFATDRSEQMDAEVWADEALGQLPPRSAILVRSPAIAWRLWSARLTRGERPDVVVIPIPLLDKGRVAASLVASERELEPLVRSHALTGELTEFALSKVADVRPLHVELNPTWPKRLISHLRLGGLWLEYAPQPLGPSDRRQSSTAATTPLRRVMVAVAGAAVPESPTAMVLATTLRADASVLHALGEREAADLVLRRLEELSARDPSVANATVPFALKGMRRAVLRREPTRAR
ncbi:Glycoprotein gp2 [Minicystis rosea]|nr:Glycoprotein gp2 [Minicystis rosea]